MGDLSAGHSRATVEICTQKYGVYESSSFVGGVRVIISWLFGRGRVGNSARLPARARTARGGTLFGPFWRARACSRHRSQEQSDNKNSTIDTTSTYLRDASISFAHCFTDFCFVSVGGVPTTIIASSHVTTVDEKQTTQHQPEQG